MREDEHWEPLAPNCRVLVSRAHRFTTDTILLAHFAAPKKRERCADLGTGCGTIPLLWHARYAPREITGVELDADALRQARESVRENGLEDKIAVKRGDIREIRAVFPEPVLDLVACNPPYKAVGAGLRNADARMENARHECTCTLGDVARAAKAVLRFGGRLCICQRPERLTRWRPSAKTASSRSGCGSWSSGRAARRCSSCSKGGAAAGRGLRFCPRCGSKRRGAASRPKCSKSTAITKRGAPNRRPRGNGETMENKLEKGALYVVGTPIGNLSDFSPRAAETLAAVDFIAAEDTRVTVKLLNHFGIKKPLVSYYEHNKQEKGSVITDRLAEGETCALVSDAGMPAISDPGEDLVALCAARGIPVYVVPGPSAVVSALAVSGLPTGRFTFEGFLSVNKKSRREHLESLRDETRTMVFYEAPHKLPYTLQDMEAVFGDRRIALVREITKIHEQCIRTTLSAAAAHYASTPPKGNQ